MRFVDQYVTIWRFYDNAGADRYILMCNPTWNVLYTSVYAGSLTVSVVAFSLLSLSFFISVLFLAGLRRPFLLLRWFAGLIILIFQYGLWNRCSAQL